MQIKFTTHRIELSDDNNKSGVISGSSHDQYFSEALVFVLDIICSVALHYLNIYCSF